MAAYLQRTHSEDNLQALELRVGFDLNCSTGTGWTFCLQNGQSNKCIILPKLGALLSVKSARTLAVMKDHMARNRLALSSVEVFPDSYK